MRGGRDACFPPAPGLRYHWPHAGACGPQCPVQETSTTVAEPTRWAFPPAIAADAGRRRLRPRVGARQRGRASGRGPGRRVHGVDPRHRSNGQRRRDPRGRPRPHHRLPDHRGRHRLADRERRLGRCRTSARLRFRDAASAWSCRSAAWELPSLERGTAASIAADDDVYVLGHGGRAHALKATVFAKREFAGFWEYLLDTALFTTPPHPEWSGAALLDEDGRLVGIGSLLLQENAGDETRRWQHVRARRSARAHSRRSRADRALGRGAAAVAGDLYRRSRGPPGRQRARRRGPCRARRASIRGISSSRSAPSASRASRISSARCGAGVRRAPRFR